MLSELILSTLMQGLIYTLVSFGVYITYSILDFPDLSVDGTFPLGGVCATIFMLRLGAPPLLAILMAMAVGMLAGTVTGV
jgi:putative ABC transport system permease protein